MDRLDVGDYCVDGGVVIERKTYLDFAMSLADGRLFPQAAALARSPHRPIVLLEGPKPPKMPDVHPHALKGALLSFGGHVAASCTRSRRLAADPAISRTTTGQNGGHLSSTLRKPKRLASRKLYMLQGLPGVGPALANRLLLQFGSVERVITADQNVLMEVRGIGAKKAQRIRHLVC